MIESEAEDKNESQLVGAVQVTGWCISQPFEHKDQECYISREFGDSFWMAEQTFLLPAQNFVSFAYFPKLPG